MSTAETTDIRAVAGEPIPAWADRELLLERRLDTALAELAEARADREAECTGRALLAALARGLARERHQALARADAAEGQLARLAPIVAANLRRMAAIRDVVEFAPPAARPRTTAWDRLLARLGGGR